MVLELSDLVKNKEGLDLRSLLSEWMWLVSEQKQVLFVSVFGDVFFLGPKNEVNWLDCGAGELMEVARTATEFQNKLANKDNIAEWFLTDLYIELQEKKILLKENEVYSYKKLPLLGGEYKIENIQTRDLATHFQSTGKICYDEQSKPDEAQDQSASGFSA